MDISSATIKDKCEGSSQLYAYKPFDKLDTASAVQSETLYENLSDLCTYNSFDIRGTFSSPINDPTQIGPEGTPCKFFQSDQCYSLPDNEPSDVLQCDGADTISDTSCNDSVSS